MTQNSIRCVTSIFLLVVCLFQISVSTPSKICPRDKSRVMSGIVKEHILPAFRQYGAPFAPECQFAIERDMYAVQEENKLNENPSRWMCDFCGKAFISEYFLDTHFTNRHAEHIQISNALCLADVCDVFRCDIVSGTATPDYWDIALCMEDDMKDLYSQCEALVSQCIPTGLTKNASTSIKNQVIENVCSFLTCGRFWNAPVQQEESTHLALYIVLTTMSCFGILIYNFVFYNYFYADLVETTYNPPRDDFTITPYPSKHEQRKPQRPRPRHQL